MQLSHSSPYPAVDTKKGMAASMLYCSRSSGKRQYCSSPFWYCPPRTAPERVSAGGRRGRHTHACAC